MKKIDLNGRWTMRELGTENWLPATVPGSVMQDLLDHGKIEDPFYRDNEYLGKLIAENDYQYKREFHISDDLFNMDHVVLVCEGIDTLSEVYVNGKKVASTNNMHHHYEWDMKPFLRPGTNEITIILLSPLKYIEKRQQEDPVWGSQDAIEGYPHIRKAHYMFGWDWGPQLPDMGIWRDIYIQAWNTARIEDVYIRQEHDNETVTVHIDTKVKLYQEKDVVLKVQLTDPDQSVETREIQLSDLEHTISITVENPQLWWPNGYGSQPLYLVDVVLEDEDENVLDRQNYRIGLRTITIRREPDQWGETFEFVINDIPIFAKGANYIPEDNLLRRVHRERTEKLIKDCVAAHFNMIRVWGGGYYPDKDFYDLCDEYGLIVWQDFMFACSSYSLTDEFAASIKKEIRDNVKRLRHHASLGIWCGNNEIETAWVNWNWPDNPKLRQDYVKIFEEIIPEIVHELDPQTFYWPSSPSSGGGFDDPNSENRGDVHYWDVWHGLKPFTEYRKFYFRFCSEFGFQSFPSLKTIKSFTLPEDRNIFSYVMEKHQKNKSANGRILYYLSQNYLYPKDFSALLYASQLLQAEAIKYGVEHWRRNRGRSMGTLYWQLNDCWPVASWSSIDYYGRWKALHYYARRFYQPILLSICEEGTDAEIHVTNDTLETIHAVVKWQLRKNTSEIIKEGTVEGKVNKLSSACLQSLSFADELAGSNIRDTYLECTLYIDGKDISEATVLFTKPKHFHFVDPGLTFQVEEESDRFIISVQAENGLAKNVELDFEEVDAIFSDNYFDLSRGNIKKVELLKSNLNKPLTREEVENSLQIRSVFDIA